MPEDAHCGLRLHGRVQGVGFRWWTRERADRMGLSGTVRNRPDGTVEVHLRGDPRSIAEMRGLLGEGPPASAVDRVEEIPAADVAPGFRIVR